MKLLRITAGGLPLFEGKIDLNFFAQQRVSPEHKNALYPLFSNVYLNPATAFIGINASGKTSVLKTILFVLDLLNNEPLNHIETKDILGCAKKCVFNSYFYCETSKEICRLETIVSSKTTKQDSVRYFIEAERLWAKAASSVITRKGLFEFNENKPELIRSDQEYFLSDDVSIMIAKNKKSNEAIQTVNLLQYTNMNVLPLSSDIPAEVIAFLDPSIESLHFEGQGSKRIIHLKFHGQKEIILNDSIELNNYLSSGTIKGMITFTLAREILQTGGYLVVDEIENHFNKEIVRTLLRFFMDAKLNKKGGTLIFSTHYPELLDEFDRNDSIYITRKGGGITAENLTDILRRNDLKKSEAYQSGFLQGTTPLYESYLQLKKRVAASIQ